MSKKQVPISKTNSGNRLVEVGHMDRHWHRCGCKVPVALKDPKQVSADSLQSPHDPDVTYSGHKGKG